MLTLSIFIFYHNQLCFGYMYSVLVYVRCFSEVLLNGNKLKSRDNLELSSSCFIKSPHGLASFYGPVVLGVAANWTMFIFIAAVIIKAIKKKAKQMGESNVQMRTVSIQQLL